MGNVWTATTALGATTAAMPGANSRCATSMVCVITVSLASEGICVLILAQATACIRSAPEIQECVPLAARITMKETSVKQREVCDAPINLQIVYTLRVIKFFPH